MKKHSGVIALMTTSLLLVVALVVTMGAYKTSLYEIKRAQNEVESRKNYWKADGLLECTLGYLRSSGQSIDVLEDTTSRPEEFTASCIANRGNVLLVVEKEVDNILTAKSNTSSLARAIVKGVNQPNSAIQVSGDLEMVGTVQITPTVGAKVKGGSYYECNSVRFSDSFTYRYSSTHSKAGGIEPAGVKEGENTAKYGYYTTPSNANKNCHPDYLTRLTTDVSEAKIDALNPNESSLFAKDFQPDTKMDLFKELFGVTGNKQNVATVSNNTDMFVKQVADELGCGAQIQTHFSSLETKEKGLWLIGNCEIDGAVAALESHGKMLVIDEGALALRGSFAFNGLVYHRADLEDKEVASKIRAFWDKKAEGTNDYKKFITKDTVGIQFYSSAPNGGLIIDTKGGKSTLVGDINLNFNASYRPTFLKGSYIWKKGAWRDF